MSNIEEASAKSISGKVVQAVDTVTIMRFVKLVSTPFEKWPAYEAGVIDKDGNTLKKRADRETPEEKQSFTLFHRLARNIKRLIMKIPFGGSILGSFAAAMFLIRESQYNPFGKNLQERWSNFIENDQKFIYDMYEVFEDNIKKELNESTTTGAVQGASFPISMDYKPEKMMGMKVFDVPTDRFMKSKNGKKKYTKFSGYVGDDGIGQKIREYGRQYPQSGIILRDEKSGSMTFLRKPSYKRK